jgi:hypothetical protein
MFPFSNTAKDNEQCITSQSKIPTKDDGDQNYTKWGKGLYQILNGILLYILIQTFTYATSTATMNMDSFWNAGQRTTSESLHDKTVNILSRIPCMCVRKCD